MEWHKKMEENRVQELRKGRELVAQKEENQHLKKLVEKQEQTIFSLENDILQQNMVRKVHRHVCNILIFREKFTSNLSKWVVNLVNGMA